MDARTRRRLQQTSRVMKLLRSRDFRHALPPLGSGPVPVVVGFLDDTMGTVYRLIDEVGGSAYVAVFRESDSRTDIQLLVVERCTDPSEGCAEDAAVVNEGSELGMLLELLEVRRARSINVRACKQDTTVSLVRDDNVMMPG